MAKNLKTFVINKPQIAALKALFIANGNQAEAENFKGSEFAYRWKCINLPEQFPKAKTEEFSKQYPYMVGFDLTSIQPEPKAKPEAKVEGATEMEAPAKKDKKSKDEAKTPVAAGDFADTEAQV